MAFRIAGSITRAIVILRTVAILMVFLTPFCSYAQVAVKGAISCGNWVKLRAEERVSGTSDAARLWVLGYLSGLGVANNVDIWRPAGMSVLDNESVYSWVDNFCLGHQSKDVDEAVDLLFIDRALGLRPSKTLTPSR